MKRIPITVAKTIAETLKQDQVILMTFEKKTGVTSVVTYGKSKDDCVEAAQGGNFLKKALGWPEDKCCDKPARLPRRKCIIKPLHSGGWMMEVDNQKISFTGVWIADYFGVHYAGLGYEVVIDKKENAV